MTGSQIHYLCQDCEGGGRRVVQRGAIVSPTRLSTSVAMETCKSCDGTGWIPPKYPQAEGE